MRFGKQCKMMNYERNKPWDLMCVLLHEATWSMLELVQTYSPRVHMQHWRIETGQSLCISGSKSKERRLCDLINIHCYSSHSYRSTASYFASSWKTTMGFTAGRCRITSLQVLNIFICHSAILMQIRTCYFTLTQTSTLPWKPVNMHFEYR